MLHAAHCVHPTRPCALPARHVAANVIRDNKSGGSLRRDGRDGSSSTSRRTRQQPHLPVERAPQIGQEEESDSVEPEPEEVASLGWMWQTGRNGSAIGGAQASTPRPTALATVANLKGDRIKAKKCVQGRSCAIRACACRGGLGDDVLPVHAACHTMLACRHCISPSRAGSVDCAHGVTRCPDAYEGACIAVHVRRSLGQNFVTDDSVLLDIVTAANVKPGELILEVRPCPCRHAGTSTRPVGDAYGWPVFGSPSASAS